jgi:2,3-bisphosphoglycerate-dependent phosphoglycerate mutase
MQVYFIRHAQSTNNELWERMGSGKGRSEDPELTEKGKKQIIELAKFVSKTPDQNLYDRRDHQNRYGFGFTHLYASPMVRALQTGLAVAQRINKPLSIWRDIHEGGGIFLENEAGEHEGLPGKPRRFFEKEYPQVILPDDLLEEGWWNRPFEPYENRRKRAELIWQRILSTHHQGDRVALFSHGGFFNYFMSWVLKQDLGEKAWFDINNVSISRFDINLETQRINIQYVNKTDFLPTELITG